MMALVLVGVMVASQQSPLPSVRHRVAAIAHRGGAAVSPENTLLAFRKAIALGADYVEVDVRTTSDGRLVLMHDGSVERTTDGQGPVRSLSLAQIRALRVRGPDGRIRRGARVPTLDEALAACRGKIGVYLDHKDADTETVLATLRKHRMDHAVIVYGGPERLREWKRLAPYIPVMPSLPDANRTPEGIAEFLRSAPADVLDGHLVEWTAELVRAAHDAGRPVYVDIMGPTDNPAGYERALQMGVDGVQTDRPDALVSFLKQSQARATDASRGVR